MVLSVLLTRTPSSPKLTSSFSMVQLCLSPICAGATWLLGTRRFPLDDEVRHHRTRWALSRNLLRSMGEIDTGQWQMAPVSQLSHSSLREIILKERGYLGVL